ncbi:hypothetical protein CDL12_25323 [Handroanthus impetiginosus]|uniref:RING-type E3 ubiquitin transferase n=1 Tax=Handroanthus impetiginosus TaxID=429701 RepID=A0A2G9GA74_9LAMI|nr:hypothetical protein CDL12_25323 [Handroanthus impetiginosus]
MSLLKFFFSVLLLFQAICARNDCLYSHLCGNNTFPVKYPFWLKDKQFLSCRGYTGFDLRCTDQNQVVLDLRYSGVFYVRDINYLMREIYLYDPNSCPARRLLNLKTAWTPFKVSNYSQNFTFLCCPSHLVGDRLTFTTIDCLSNSTVSVLATSSMNQARYINMCTYGLVLTWDSPDCKEYDARRCICGFENSLSYQVSSSTDQDDGTGKWFFIYFFHFFLRVVCACVCERERERV